MPAQLITSSIFMEAALEQARIAGKLMEVPVGAVIVDNNSREIIASAHNMVEQNNDPTAHAEIMVIRAACIKTGNKFLTNHSLYVTLEPCAMCGYAISLARLNAFYYGASDAKSGGVEHGAKVFQNGSCHHRPEIYSGIYQRESSKILQEFFSSLR